MNHPARIGYAHADGDTFKEVVLRSEPEHVSPQWSIHKKQFDLPQAPRAQPLARRGSPGAPLVPAKPRRGSPGAPLVPEKPWLNPDASGGEQQQPLVPAPPAQQSLPYQSEAWHPSAWQQPAPQMLYPNAGQYGGAPDKLPLRILADRQATPPPPPYELQAGVHPSTRQQPTPQRQTSGPDAYRHDGVLNGASPEIPASHQGTSPRPYQARSMAPQPRLSTVEQYPVDIDFLERQEPERDLGPAFLPKGLEAFRYNDPRSAPRPRSTLRGAMSSFRSSLKQLFLPFSGRNPDRLKKYE